MNRTGSFERSLQRGDDQSLTSNENYVAPEMQIANCFKNDTRIFFRQRIFQACHSIPCWPNEKHWPCYGYAKLFEDVGPRENVCLCFLDRICPPARSSPFASGCKRTFIFLAPVSLIVGTLQALCKKNYALPRPRGRFTSRI